MKHSLYLKFILAYLIFGFLSFFTIAVFSSQLTLDYLTKNEAELMVHRENRKRKEYHNYYSTVKWGDSRNYDMTINSGRLGIDKTVDILETYIRERNNLIQENNSI